MAGPQFLWFLPLSHGKNAVALLVKKILVSNFPLSTFWMWYMIFFRKK